ncbi:hypothetical protein [Aeromicrobium sp.]|uniref:hypothetical protein n=1 Tax=Aeromicrobium sp. TaxID=1871063 RepID=UPI003C578F10
MNRPDVGTTSLRGATEVLLKEGTEMSDIDWWVWVVAAIAVVVVVLALVMASRRASTNKQVKQREDNERRRVEATGIRDEAHVASVEAQRSEADAATAHADAEEARLAADRLEQQAADRDHEATQQRDAVDERLAEADRIDPDVHDDGSRRHMNAAAENADEPAGDPMHDASHARRDDTV